MKWELESSMEIFYSKIQIHLFLLLLQLVNLLLNKCEFLNDIGFLQSHAFHFVNFIFSLFEIFTFRNEKDWRNSFWRPVFGSMDSLSEENRFYNLMGPLISLCYLHFSINHKTRRLLYNISIQATNCKSNL